MQNDNEFIVVCVIGQPGSGKDTLANYLEKIKGFSYISTGNIIREEMKARNIPIDRESMRVFSQDMRKKVGNSYPANIAAMAANRIARDIVISGPRNVAEVEVFKNKFGKNFLLVAVNAPIEIRYERVKNGRGRAGDNITFAQFKAQEDAELNSGTHELSKLLAITDRSVDNSGDEKDMFAQMDDILRKLLALKLKKQLHHQ